VNGFTMSSAIDKRAGLWGFPGDWGCGRFLEFAATMAACINMNEFSI
jgi:hypothetical protein